MSEFNASAPVETPAPSPASPVAPAAQATPAPSPQAVAPAQAPATGAAPQVDPSWLKSRLDETRRSGYTQAQQAFAQKEAQYQAQLEAIQRQLHAVVGVTPPQNPEIDAIRKQFGGLYPGLSKLEERSAQVEALLERMGDFETQTEHYWQSYGRQTVDRLFSKAAEASGTPLTDEAKRFLHSSFVGFVQSSPENSQRYETDPTIVDDFIRVFTSSFIDPSRRQATAQLAGRAPQGLPQDTPAGSPMVPGAPKPKDLDERAALGWAQLNANRSGF